MKSLLPFYAGTLGSLLFLMRPSSALALLAMAYLGERLSLKKRRGNLSRPVESMSIHNSRRRVSSVYGPDSRSTSRIHTTGETVIDSKIHHQH
ncbi:hypothetical protein BT96DRAFT_922671 [Gymnopus androsaceus JB14]|uniref:Uncharacterized protein n=1 Tax=Gymnopus androsaceus JB14 TaxID=1447944 RepID=A0A6A4HCY8_9AGAR|nr:hypothetical protein BT96DRAFT_922671 [Gymnopus androsaceus JB14]